MGSSILWILVVFVGGAIVLAAAIAWAQRNNKKQSRAEFERGERATRELYDGDPVDRRPN